MIKEFFETLDNTFSSGDPEVRQWFLVRQAYLPFLLCSIYALFSTVVGPALMRNRKPLKIRNIMVIFNCAIVFTYVFALIILFVNIQKITWHIFCVEAKVVPGTPVSKLANAAWIVYAVKYLEFFDTVFFVLRKKEKHISFLHVIHHTSVPIIGWILIRTEKSGMQAVPVVVNGIVHIIMYSYYALAALGPHVRKYLWWKKYLTQLQMAQFIFIIMFVTVVTPLSGCSMMKSSYIIDIMFGTLFLFLFYQYYRRNFRKSKKKQVQ